MSVEPIRIGVIGAGWFVSRRHLPDLQQCPSARLAALCRRDPQQLARMAAHFGVPATYTDYRQMLDEEPLDAVIIATPHSLHFEHARAALERGLHVLLEKPMAVRSEDARTLTRLAREKGRQLVVALNPPYWAHCQRLREWVASGRLGDLESVDIHWLGSAPHVFGKAPMPANLPGVVPPTLFRGDPEMGGGGFLMDTGSHLVSEILWATGLRVTRVQAAMDDPDTDMRAALVMETETGVPCTLTLRGDSAHPQRRLHNVYYGSKATAYSEGMPFSLTLRDTGQAEERVAEAEMPRVPVPVADFLDAIRGESAPRGTAEHGAEVVAVLEAAYRSVRTGTVEPVG